MVVVGAGLAGLAACEALRRQGYQEEIVLVGDEPYEPYDRPPLSKQFLAGEWGVDKVVLRNPERMAELELSRRKETLATGLDLKTSSVRLSSGEQLYFDGLVIATGSMARRLPAFEHLAHAHVLRSLGDAEALRKELRPGARLLVVGGGFIGMEVAATARRLGLEVSVVEPLAVPLGRVLGELTGRACEALHRDNGVLFHLGVGIESVSEEGSQSTLRAVLSDGSVLQADVAVVGIGASPNVGWLEGSGLEVGPSGVACDASLLAAPRVAVAGDVARFPYGPRGVPVRLEHRTNAAEQGEHAARSLLSGPSAFETVPYVWSDQYSTKIQLLGLPEPDDRVEVVAGSIKEGRFVALYERGGLLSAAVGFSMPRALMGFRKLLAEPTPFEVALSASS
jgi:3-phenylpropionate/trans-cinnamate dioxygenase ferredoxin reductase subunit